MPLVYVHRYTKKKGGGKTERKRNEMKYIYKERERGEEKKEKKMYDRKRSRFVERIKMDATGGVFWISLFQRER